jgi:phage terminase large subunit
MLRSRADMVLMSGAAGTGKSVPAMMKLHLACLQVPRIRCLVVRKTLTSLTASTLVSFREKVAAEAIAAGIVRWYGGSSAEPAAYRYPNKSVIVVGGLDQPTRLMSTEYDLAFLDEAIEATPQDVDTITTRLRNGRLPYQQLLMATNPDASTHHLKQRADRNGLVMLFSRHEDNPLLWENGEWTPRGQAYLQRLDQLTGARYQRLRWGRWVSSEGTVYEDWSPAVHVLDRFEPPPSWTRWHVIDWGYTNPFVWQEWAEDPDGRLFLLREVYRTRRLVEDHARHVLRLCAPEGKWVVPKPRAVIADHDAEDRATWERHFGMSTVPAVKAVAEGIQAVQARLRSAGDGKPRLFVLRDALVERDPELAEVSKPTCTVEEIDGYVWEPAKTGKEEKERPLKLNDHAMDCMRYLCAEVDQGARPRVRILG